jgi:putative ABC transport system permease protein
MAGNTLTQIVAVTAMNLRNIRERIGSTLVALVGVAGVVTVVVGVLSMGEGFRAVLDQAGAEDVGIVLRGGATDEMGSYFSQDNARIMADAPQIARDAAGPLVSSELYVIVNVPLKRTGTVANVPLRGVGQSAPKLRQGFQITEGRMFTPGTFEVIVGRGALAQFAGLEVGDVIRSGRAEWKVVGHFRDAGSVAESEIWTDAPVLQGAYQRGTSFQSVRARLSSASALTAFRDLLTTNPQLNVKVFSERDYYQQLSATLVAVVGTVGAVIAVLMGLGAIFAALNTMYSAVSARTREIATLRALGFSASPVIVSVLIEAVLIGIVGGLIGVAVAYLTLNGMEASTLNFATFSQITFAFRVTPELLVRGLVYSVALGFFGGLFPAIRAARLPVVTGLREL